MWVPQVGQRSGGLSFVTRLLGNRRSGQMGEPSTFTFVNYLKKVRANSVGRLYSSRGFPDRIPS